MTDNQGITPKHLRNLGNLPPMMCAPCNEEFPDYAGIAAHMQAEHGVPSIEPETVQPSDSASMPQPDPTNTEIENILNSLIMEYNQRLKIGNSRNLKALDRATTAITKLVQEARLNELLRVPASYGGAELDEYTKTRLKALQEGNK